MTKSFHSFTKEWPTREMKHDEWNRYAEFFRAADNREKARFLAESNAHQSYSNGKKISACTNSFLEACLELPDNIKDLYRHFKANGAIALKDYFSYRRLKVLSVINRFRGKV